MTTVYEDQQLWMCNEVSSKVPGADTANIQRAYLAVRDEFLQKSSAWRENAVFTSDEFGNVEVGFSDNGVVAGQMYTIERVLYEGRPVTLVDVIPTNREDEEASSPRYYKNLPYPNVLSLWPRPFSGQSFDVDVHAVVTFDDEAEVDLPLPDWLFSRHKRTLVHGVQGRLHEEMGKPYSSFELSKWHLAIFSHATIDARIQAQQNYSRASRTPQIAGGFHV